MGKTQKSVCCCCCYDPLKNTAKRLLLLLGFFFFFSPLFLFLLWIWIENGVYKIFSFSLFFFSLQFTCFFFSFLCNVQVSDGNRGIINNLFLSHPSFVGFFGKNFNGNITRKDLQTKTPYNTYKIPALPPTPIAMASAASINAVLHPADTKALFFVADGTGGHVFNETVEGHNKAVKRFIMKRK